MTTAHPMPLQLLRQVSTWIRSRLEIGDVRLGIYRRRLIMRQEGPEVSDVPNEDFDQAVEELLHLAELAVLSDAPPPLSTDPRSDDDMNERLSLAASLVSDDLREEFRFATFVKDAILHHLEADPRMRPKVSAEGRPEVGSFLVTLVTRKTRADELESLEFEIRPKEARHLSDLFAKMADELEAYQRKRIH